MDETSECIESLCIAVQNCNTKEVKDILSKNKNLLNEISHSVGYGNKIHVLRTYVSACLNNSAKLIRVLIKQGVDINSKNQVNESATHFAACAEDVQVLECLLSNGAEINNKNCRGETPLHLACSFNKFSNMRLLVQRGADISAQDYMRRLPFELFDKDFPDYEKCLYTMVKEVARLSFDRVVIPEVVLDLIKKVERLTVFSDCQKELTKMNGTIVHGNYSLYTTLKMSHELKKSPEYGDIILKF